MIHKKYKCYGENKPEKGGVCVCVWSRGSGWDGEEGILYQVVRGSLTSESRSK